MTTKSLKLNDIVRLEIDAADLVNQVANHSAQTGSTVGWSADTGITLAAQTSPPNRPKLNLTSWDPSFEGATILGGAGGAATITKATDWYFDGTKSLKITPAAGNNASAFYPFFASFTDSIGATFNRMGIEAGKTYTVSASVRTTAAQSGTPSPDARRIVINRLAGGVIGAVLATSPQADNVGGGARLRVTFTVPEDATDIALRLTNGSAVATEPIWWDAILIEEGTTTGVFTESLTGLFNGSKAIRATYAAATAVLYAAIYTPSLPVVPGQWLGVQFGFADTLRAVVPDVSLRVETSLIFYDSGGLVIPGNLVGGVDARYPGTWSVETNGYRSATIFPDQKVPTGAATAKIKIMFWDQNKRTGARNEINRAVYLTKMMVVMSAKVEDVKNVPFPDADVWQNILGSSISVNARRGGDVSGVTDDIEAGLVTATIRDLVVDPTKNSRIRPGRRMRITACPGDPQVDPFLPIFTGKISQVDMGYPTIKEGNARPQVVITGSDAVAELVNVPSPYAYAGTLGPKVRALMAASTVPYTTDGGAVSTTKTALIDGSTLWDQLLLARNSFTNAKAYVDASGTVQAKLQPVTDVLYTLSDTEPTLLSNVVLNPSFEGDTYLGWRVNVNLARSQVWASRGTSSVRISCRVTGSLVHYYPYTGSASPGYFVTPRAYLHMQAKVKAISDVRVKVILRADGGVDEESFYADLKAGDETTLEIKNHRGISGAAYQVLLEFYDFGTTTNFSTLADLIFLDEMIMCATLGPLSALFYFDGSAKARNLGIVYWTSTVNASPSTYVGGAAVSYLDLDLTFGSKSLVNQLMLTRTNADEPEGEKTYGPYTNASSVVDWGTVSAEVHVIDGVASDLATDYLAKYATPTVFPSSLRFNALEVEAWNVQLAWVELYAGVRVLNEQASLDRTVLVIGIEHEITPAGWFVTLRFRPADVSTAVAITNGSGGMSAGPADLITPTPGILAARRLGAATQSTANAAFISVDLDTAITMDGGVTWDSVNRRITVPKAGRYVITGAITWAGNATGRRANRILINGGVAATPGQVESTPGAQLHTLGYARVVHLDANDTVTLQAYQTSEAALNLSSAGTWLDVAWIGL